MTQESDAQGTPVEVVIFKDGAGEYFVVPVATLEQGRVPAEHKAEVEGFLAEAAEADVSGYADRLQTVMMVTGAEAVYIGTLAILGGATQWGSDLVTKGLKAAPYGNAVAIGGHTPS